MKKPELIVVLRIITSLLKKAAAINNRSRKKYQLIIISIAATAAAMIIISRAFAYRTIVTSAATGFRLRNSRNVGVQISIIAVRQLKAFLNQISICLNSLLDIAHTTNQQSTTAIGCSTADTGSNY